MIAAALAVPALRSTASFAAATPNIVVLLADDMNADDLAYMPRTLERLAQQGAQFNSYYANVSLCGPSRATFLTGKYTQNSRVKTNSYSQFVAGHNEYANLGYWLNAAGYRTGLIGKYINSYPKPMPVGYVPPGWNYWFVVDGGDLYGQYNYRVNDNGVSRSFGSTEQEYATDVYRDRAVDFIRTATTDGVPYFCYLAFTSPHSPATPPPRYQALFPGVLLPEKPSANEEDVGDKPAYVQATPVLTSSKIASLNKIYRKRLQSLQAIDEAVDAVFQAIGDAGLENTYVVFSSDNGDLFGEHRLVGKSGPYDEMVHMPLLVRGPGIAPGLQVDALTGNVDMAPTLLDLAGVTVTAAFDGRSLAGWLQQQPPESWRAGYQLRLAGTVNLSFPKYSGFRTPHHAYYLYADGGQELYDLVADPYQLTNIVDTLPPETVASYAAVATELAACHGPECRLLDADPRLPD